MKSTIERLHRLLQLPPSERVILAQAWGLFLLVDIALRLLPLKHLLALCQRTPLGRREDSLVPSPSLPRLVWLVEVAGRYAPVNTTCLKKALILSWLLERRGIQTELQIGVARRDGTLIAHAWLERKGQVILGPPGSDGYEPLLSA